MTSPGDRRVARAVLACAPLVIAWLVAIAPVVVGCSGQAQNPVQPDVTEISCLVTIDSYCCQNTTTPTCIPTFADAQECAAWPTGAKLAVYATPCQGLTAVRETGSAYSTFYVYDSGGALLAVGDNASTTSGGSIECGAGPTKVDLPAVCVSEWTGTSGSPCASGSASAGASVCQ